MKKNKILFLINTLSCGGAEKALIDIVNNIDKNKFDITLQTLFNEGPYIKELNNEIKYKTIIRNPNSKIGKILKIFLVKYIKESKCIFLYKLFIKKDYNIEISFLEGMPTKIIGCQKNKNIKKIAWVHTDMSANFESQCFFKDFHTHKKSYLNYDKIICVSEDAKKQFEKRFEYNDDNIFVQYNLLDKEKILEKAKEHVSENIFNRDVLNICSVGRLVYAKGYDRLISATKKLVDEGYKINLYIIGDGEEKEKLNNYIKENNLEDKIYLLGFRKNPYKYMSRCNIALLSSRYEGLSLFINEALFLEKVILATECTGPKELLKDGEFGLILENSEHGLYEGIKKIIDNKELYKYYQKKVKEYSKSYDKESRVYEIEQKILN